MYFLVHVGILRFDDEFQLAHEDRIVPVPDVWWRYSDTNTNAHPDANADSNSDSDTNAHANTDSNADPSACAECAEQSGWNGRFNDSDQLVVDG